MTPDRQSTLRIDAIREPPSVWVLEVQDESGGRSVPIGERPLLVGTSSRADIVLSDPTVSKKHLELSVLGGGIAVRDCGSKNGTFVGTARVDEAWAASGTMITIGRSSIVCSAALEEDVDVATTPLAGLAGASAAMRRIAAHVRRLAKYSAPVLIFGESGTGKEQVARSLHDEGPRAGRPFVPLNVTVLPRELVESELFGHERGAFTGAVARRIGAFAEAKGGTLFLDEIGELPIEAQPKLLRALDGYDLRRLGGSGAASPEARVVAATNVRLEQLVTRGAFRRDLFHRLEVFVVTMPPLRERRGDIGAIAAQLLYGMQGDHGARVLTSAALARLAAHDWPGNVRELRNALARASDLAQSKPVLDVADVERGMTRSLPPNEPIRLTPDFARDLLRQHGGNLSAAARSVRCPRTTFRKLLARMK